MSEREEEDLLVLFDSLDEAAQDEALAAALKIISGEILRETVPESGTVLLFLPALQPEHKGKQFVPLLSGHAVHQAHKLLPHRIRRRLLFPQQVGDGAAEILRQQLYLGNRRRLASLYVVYKADAYASLAAGHGGLDTFCAAALLDILHKKFFVHDDLILYANYAK